jgi:hypothetical protein
MLLLTEVVKIVIVLFIVSLLSSSKDFNVLLALNNPRQAFGLYLAAGAVCRGLYG